MTPRGRHYITNSRQIVDWMSKYRLIIRIFVLKFTLFITHCLNWDLIGPKSGEPKMADMAAVFCRQFHFPQRSFRRQFVNDDRLGA